MAADRLILQNMIFYGYHGVFAAEKELGQRFEVDAELYLDLRQAGINDDLEATVNYAEVYTIIKELVEEREYNLLEALAEQIADTLLAAYPSRKLWSGSGNPSLPLVVSWIILGSKSGVGPRN